MTEPPSWGVETSTGLGLIMPRRSNYGTRHQPPAPPHFTPPASTLHSLGTPKSSPSLQRFGHQSSMSCEDDVQYSSTLPDQQHTQSSRCYRVSKLSKMSEMRTSTMLICYQVYSRLRVQVRRRCDWITGSSATRRVVLESVYYAGLDNPELRVF
jgi:hypothetical protein